jgi:hypothetical protein
MALVFVHIGMMRAASTWLHKWLAAHPELDSPWPSLDVFAPKNPYFWNRGDPLGRPPRLLGKELPIASLEEYRALADSAPKTIDVTDSMSFMSVEQIEALKAAYPDVLVSYTRRDATDALWSHLRLHCLDRATDATPRMLANIQCSENLARWRSCGFEPHVIEFSQIEHDSLLVLRGLACRLGIDPDWWTPHAEEVRHAA